MGLIQMLQQQDDFTATECAIADFILQNPEEFMQCSSMDLAKASCSSKSAITRLCQKLGQENLKNFRTAFAVELEKQRLERSEVDINFPFSDSERAASVMRSVNLISKEALDACYASISPGSIDHIAKVLSEAKHIYLYGIGDTYITACAFSNMLMKLGIHCILTEQYHERLGVTYSAREGDVALFLTYSGDFMQFVHQELGILRRKHCTTILISTLKKVNGIDYHIVIPAKEKAVGKTAGYYSQAALRYVLNCLYGVIYARDLKRNMSYKNRIDGVPLP